MALFLVVLMMALTQASPEAGSIEGVVRRTGGIDPLAEVQVTLSKAGSAPFMTKTNDAGRFAFKDLAPGEYRIFAQRDAYLRPSRGGGPQVLTIASKQQLKDVILTLIPGGTISGRVLDANGQPMRGVQVTTFQLGYVNGRKAPAVTLGLPPTTRAQTNDRGEYRLFWFLPGDYFVRAETPLAPGSASPRRIAYYPGTRDPAAAVPLSVKEGAESSSIDFTLKPPDTTGLHSISGTVVLPPGRLGSGIVGSFYLYPHGREVGIEGNGYTILETNGASSMANGNFTLRNIAPGTYDVIVGGAISPRGRVRVVVGDRDIENVTIPIPPTVDFKGSVTVNGATASFPLSRFRVTLMPDHHLAPYSSSVAPDGVLTFPGIVEGKYTVAVDAGIPIGAGPDVVSNAYVEDVRQGGKSISQGVRTFEDAVVTVAADASPLEVILNPAGGTISGVVMDARNSEVADATVTLVPQGTQRQNAMLYRSVTTDGTGKFTLGGVAPGAYKIFAWDNIPSGAHQSAEFLSPFDARGTTINAAAAQRLDVKLSLISRETTR